MALPNKIKKIKLPDNSEYEIIPDRLQNSGYELAPPTLTQDSTIALTSDLPTVNNKTLTIQLNGSNVQTFTANSASDKTANIKALPNYSINISHTIAGHPLLVKFLTVNYSANGQYEGIYIKLGAMSCHPDGYGYQYLDDIIIGVRPSNGQITCKIYKYIQVAANNPVDGVTRYDGDVFYVNDTVNKIVDFYICGGQYSSSDFTPYTKIGSTSTKGITQYSGTATYYSSGTKVWADGCGTTYAVKSDIPTVNNNTITLTQGGVTKGSFTLNQSSDATISLDAGGGSIDYNELENIPIENVLSGTTYEEGRYYKKADESGVLLPFNGDDYVSYIYCDTSKSSELSSLLATFDYSQIPESATVGACYMVEGKTGNWGLIAFKDTSSGTNYVVGLLSGQGISPIYATGSGTLVIDGDNFPYIQGWQNLDSDNKYSLPSSAQIRGAYQDGWNGIMFGKDIGTILGAIARYESGVLNNLLTQKDAEIIEDSIKNELVIDGGTVSYTSLVTNHYASYTMPSTVFNALLNTGVSSILKISAIYDSNNAYYIYFRVTAIEIGDSGTYKAIQVSNIGSEVTFYFNGDFSTDTLSRTLYITTKGTKDFVNGLHTHPNKSALDGFEVTTTSVTDGTTTFNQYTHPTTTAVTAGLYEVGCDSLGHTIIGNSFTIPDTSNMVTTNTTQTISGTKTFSGTTVFSNGISVTHDVKTDYLEVSSAGHETGTYGKIATLSSTGYIRYRTPAEIASDIGCIPLTGSSAITGSLTPSTASNSQTLGTNANKWNAIYGTNFYSSSDERLKENIEDTELDCRQLVKDIEIKEFNFKDDKDKKVVVGAIAQQLKGILPEKYQKELISGDDDSYYSINESKLVYVVMKALQDEMYKNEVLEDRVEELEKEIGEIKYAILHQI